MRVEQADGLITSAIHLQGEGYSISVKKTVNNTILLNLFSGRVARPCSFVQKCITSFVVSMNFFLHTRRKLIFAGVFNLQGIKYMRVLHRWCTMSAVVPCRRVTNARCS